MQKSGHEVEKVCASVCAHRDTSVLHVSVICRYATWNYSKAEEIYYGSYNICINLMHKLASSCQSLWPVLLPDIIIHQHNLKPLLSFDCRRDKPRIQVYACREAINWFKYDREDGQHIFFLIVCYVDLLKSYASALLQ